MRPTVLLLSGVAAFVAACERPPEPEVERALDAVSVIDEANLNEAMLSASNPAEAVLYFRSASEAKPGRLDLRRGLARAHSRAGQHDEAAAAWERVLAHPGASHADRVALAGAQVRVGDWDRAEATLAAVPPTHESFERYRLAAMVADSKREWQRADSFYDSALDLAPLPAGVLNNWGFSHLSRGDAAGAERLFARALTYDPSLFTAKNNLVLARGARRNYDLPVVSMTQTERAMLLHTAAISAIKQGDVATGRTLLREAIETHPQHFEAAARSLEALESGPAG